MTADCHIHVIFYSEETRAGIEPGYLGLDNTGNVRPDWREYWSIRNFLHTENLQEDAFYGFFSPRFREKTGLSAPEVLNYIAAVADEADIVTFSPQVDIGAFFRNSLLGSEFADPGSLDLAQAFIDRVGLNFSLRHALMDSRTTIFSNYFVARPWVWREWFSLTEQLFNIAEFGTGNDPLRSGLLSATSYENVTGGRTPVQRKVFLLEGVISILLLAKPAIRIKQFNPFRLNWSSQLASFYEEAIICDALKTAVLERGFSEYLAVHEELSTRVLNAVFGPKRNPPLRLELLANERHNETLLQLLPRDAGLVVEVGEKTQSLSEVYLSNSPSTRWVNLDPERIVEAEKYGDADAWVLLDSFGGIEAPEHFLKMLRKILKKTAVVYVCVSNLQHWSVVSRLVLGGHGADADAGRLYDRRQVEKIFAVAGFHILKFIGRTPHSPEGDVFRQQIRQLARMIGSKGEEAQIDTNVLQFVIQAVPDASSAQEIIPGN